MIKKTLLVVFGLFASMSCGPTPAETAWQVRTYGVFCDRFHECLNTPDLKGIPFTFYLGANAGDCRAAYDEAFADASTRGTFSNRSFVQAEADKCTDAVAKLDCAAVKEIAARAISTQNAPNGSDLEATVFKDARAKLGVAADFSCQVDATTCRQSPSCTLATNNGACALHRIAPLKDPNLKGKEIEAYTTAPGASLVGCGEVIGF